MYLAMLIFHIADTLEYPIVVEANTHQNLVFVSMEIIAFKIKNLVVHTVFLSVEINLLKNLEPCFTNKFRLHANIFLKSKILFRKYFSVSFK